MVLKTNTAGDNLWKTVFVFLELLDVKVSAKTVATTLTSHPDYPSLSAISSALKKWHVDSLAMEVLPELLDTMPTPFIVHYQDEGGYFAVVRSVENDRIEWFHPRKGWQQDTVPAFTQQWSKIVLFAEPEASTSKSHNKVDGRRETRKYILVSGCLLIALLSLNLYLFSWSLVSWLVIKLIGVGICSLLISVTLDQQHSLVKRLCQINGEADCKSVLSSPAATIGGLVSWSEVGLIYFVGGWLALVYAGIRHDEAGIDAVRVVLLEATTVVLPFTGLSIWYQGWVIHRWCPLCLLVLLLIWTEAITGWAAGLRYDLPNWSGIQIVSLSFFVPVVALIAVKPLLTNTADVALIRRQLAYFLQNSTVFYQLLYQQPSLKGSLPADSLVVVGNQDATLTLTIVTNPFCKPCIQLHHRLIELLNTNRLIKAHLIIAVTSRSNDPKRKVAYELLKLPPEQRLNQLNQWLNEPSEILLKRLDRRICDAPDDTVNTWLTLHEEWCAQNNVAATPSVYLNGYQIPDGYQLSDVVELAQYQYSTDENRAVFDTNS